MHELEVKKLKAKAQIQKRNTQIKKQEKKEKRIKNERLVKKKFHVCKEKLRCRNIAFELK